MLAPMLFAMPVHGQQAATVPASSGVYEKLEAISAQFPARGVFLGERPLSRGELQRVVRLLGTAIDSGSQRIDAARRDWARVELAAVMAALNDARGLNRHASVVVGTSGRTELFASDALSERIMPNGMGSIDAVSHPWAPRREGWPTGQGIVETLAPSGVLAVRDWLAIVVEPRFAIGHFRDGARAEDVFIHRAYVRAAVRNVALQLGADERMWGQSPLSPMFISGHSSPPPALMLGTDTAITLPWLFRLAGPVRMSGLLADLGPSQDPPHARLAGWHVGMAPWSRFELGVSVLVQTGGGDCASRGTCASLFKRIVDLFPIIDALAPQHADLQISNKVAGGNLRLRLPELSGLDLYYELQIDDFDARRLRSSFVDDAGHLLGARLPLSVENGELAWRAEWHRTSLRLYEHSQYRSGTTYRERLIGDPLGPNATAGYLSATWQPPSRTTIQVTLADERRDPSHYTVIATGPRDRGFVFIRDTVKANYRRLRATASFERPFGFGALRLTTGYNRAWREGEPARGEWLGALAISTHRLRTF